MNLEKEDAMEYLKYQVKEFGLDFCLKVRTIKDGGTPMVPLPKKDHKTGYLR